MAALQKQLSEAREAYRALQADMEEHSQQHAAASAIQKCFRERRLERMADQKFRDAQVCAAGHALRVRCVALVNACVHVHINVNA